MARVTASKIPGVTNPPKKGKAPTASASAPHVHATATTGASGPRLAATLPPDVAAEAAKRKAALVAKLGTIKEHPKSIIENVKVERKFSAESIVLDEVLGLHGIPANGRMLQVHGEAHTGKSTLLYHLAGAYQRQTGRPIWIWDLEQQLELNYLWQCGLDPDPTMTFVRQTTDMNEILRNTWELMGDGLHTPDCDYFIFDSVGCMNVPVSDKDIKKNEALDVSVGQQAKIVKKFLQIIQPRAVRSDSVIHFVNQQVSIIPQTAQEQRAMKYATVTNWNYTISGGKAARYYPSIMLSTELAKAFEGAGEDEEWLFPQQEEGASKHGVGRNWDINKSKVRVLKNKINNGGYREHHIYIRPGGGIDDWASVRELARHYDLINAGRGGVVVGKAEAPLATFKSKAQAIQALVIEQRMDLLEPLRELTVDAIRADDPRAFHYERTAADIKATTDASDGAPTLDLESEVGADFVPDMD